MKKTLALVLAFALVFSTVTFAFADDAAISADAKVCADLGMLVGDGNGVTAAYTATAPTRIQSAVMFLRLKGLYDEAIKFAGTDNFADGNIAWAEGKNLLAYLKANPQLGWQGDGKNFNPNNPITAKEYYKVMLQALGYVQSSATVAGGDFSWDNVIEFAATKGLTKAAAVASFTINDVAVATVEALKGNMKEGNKTLVAALIEAGKVDKTKAVAAGLFTEVATTTAKVELVKGIANTKVLVGFDADVDKAFAENVANYKVVEKGTTTALEVKAAVLDGTDKVVVETAAQTVGKAYTMTVGTVSINFGGVAKDSAAPSVDTVEGTDTNRVTVTYDMMMDLNVLDPSHYALNNNAKVVSVAWDDNEDRVAVVLTTEGLVTSKGYKLTVTNVNSVDGVVLKSDSASFTAKSDKKAPELKNVIKKTNNRILIAFKEENDLNEAVAENVANYAIATDNSAKTALEVVSAKLLDKADVDSDGTKESLVEVMTAAQKSGQRYKVTVSNIADDSVLGNAMKESDDDTFNGVAADEDGPSFDGVQIKTKNMIEVTFGEDGASRLDKTTALDVANYSVNNDVTVEKVVMKDDDDDDCKVVRVYTSELGDDSSYKVTVANVADEFGNVMDEATTKTARYNSSVEDPATITSAVATSNSEIVIYFATKDIDATSAEDVANYSIDGDIGTPKTASFDEDDQTVTLKTAEMDGNTTYTVTVNGVKDIADNVIVNREVDVVVASTENDTTAPEIQDVEVVNKDVVRVTFDEPIDVSGTAPTITIANATSATLGTWVVSTDDNDKELEFNLNAYLVVADADKDVKITATTAADLAGNVAVADNEAVVVSDNQDDLDPANPELLSYEQVSVKKFKLEYDEKVKLDTTPGAGASYSVVNDETTINRNTASNIPYTLTVSVDGDDEHIVYLETSVPMDPDKETFELVLGNILTNKHDIAVDDADENDAGDAVTILDIQEEDDYAPYVEDVTVKDNKTVDVTFSEDLDTTTAETRGNYTIKDSDDNTVAINTADLDDNVVTLNLTGTLKGGESYTLDVKNVKDIANNTMDTVEGLEFDGTNVKPMGIYATGVEVVNGTKLNVYTSDDVTPVAITVYNADGDVLRTVGPQAADNEFTITPVAANNPGYAFVDGEDYYVTIFTASTHYTVDFAGIVGDDDLTVDKVDATTTFDVSYGDWKAGDHMVVQDSLTHLWAPVVPNADGFFTTDATSEAVMIIRNGVVLSYSVLE